jgi:ketosteroid isomerase-like protein
MLRLRASVVVAAALSTACQSAAPAPLSGADVAAIHKLDEEFGRLAVKGDFAALVPMFYTPDAAFLPPNAPTARGHAAIEAVFRTLPPLSKFELRSDDIAGQGDLAYSCGTYALTMNPPANAPLQDHGKFIVVYRRQPDGGWKATRDIYNSDVAPAAPGK